MRTRVRGSVNRPQCQVGSRQISSSWSPPYDGSVQCENLSPAVVTRTYSPSRDTRESMTDSLTPGYFQKIKEGIPLPVNDMNSSGIRLHMDEVNIDYDIRRTLSTSCDRKLGFIRGCFPGGLNFSSSAPSISSSGLLTEALAAANTSNWDVLTFAAEFHKTKELVRGAASRVDQRQSKILDIMSKRRRRRRPNYGEVAKEFSDMWLELRYGWRLLAFDIEDASTAVMSLDKLGTTYNRVTRSETTTGSTSLSSPIYLHGSHGHYRYETRSERVARAGVCIKLDVNSPVRADPLATAYELVPWSFVVDWIVNVGDNVNAYSPFAMGSLAWSFVSEKHTQTCVGEISVGHGLSADHSGIVPWTTGLLAEKVTYSRRAQNPAFSLEFRPNLNLFKGADLVALAWGIVTKKQRALRRIARL